MSGECSTRPGGVRRPLQVAVSHQISAISSVVFEGLLSELAIFSGHWKEVALHYLSAKSLKHQDMILTTLSLGVPRAESRQLRADSPPKFGMITVDRGHDAENTEDHKPWGQF